MQTKKEVTTISTNKIEEYFNSLNEAPKAKTRVLSPFAFTRNGGKYFFVTSEKLDGTKRRTFSVRFYDWNENLVKFHSEYKLLNTSGKAYTRLRRVLNE